LSYVRFSSRAL